MAEETCRLATRPAARLACAVLNRPPPPCSRLRNKQALTRESRVRRSRPYCGGVSWSAVCLRSPLASWITLVRQPVYPAGPTGEQLLMPGGADGLEALRAHRPGLHLLRRPALAACSAESDSARLPDGGRRRRPGRRSSAGKDRCRRR